jgi:hypothetical protein
MIDFLKNRIGNVPETLAFLNRHDVMNYRIEVEKRSQKGSYIEVMILQKISKVRKNKMMKDLDFNKTAPLAFALKFNNK